MAAPPGGYNRAGIAGPAWSSAGPAVVSRDRGSRPGTWRKRVKF